MTNTRITDPEILERRYCCVCDTKTMTRFQHLFRYPVILKCFCLKEGTGGLGQYRGGDGVLREVMFRRPLTLSVLTERRVYQPYGMNGVYMCVNE